jgi:hypothetical protein
VIDNILSTDGDVASYDASTNSQLNHKKAQKTGN